ncbi:MAG: hypothetical protein ACJ0G9_00320 [Alphaproteobacteria bacterium]|tara:strand:- start:261 stop:386 length:126 start_codon:yes stop_codon:yes gene_type:complete
MFITRVIGKAIVSAALLGGGYILYKRIKKRKIMLDKDKAKE